MAAIAFKENCAPIADTNTLAGPAEFKLVLVGGSANAALTMTVGAVETMALSAVIGDTASSPRLKLGEGITATFALAGTGAKAFAILEID